MNAPLSSGIGPRRLTLSPWLAALVLGISPPALANPETLPAPVEGATTPGVAAGERLQVAQVVGGGVSLGIFEAGFLYYLSEYLKLNEAAARPSIFTGTSSGSANAVVSLIESCRPLQPDPRASLFWKVWVPIGINDLDTPGGTDPLGAFSKEPLRRALGAAETAFREGLRPDCDALLGISATRVDPVQVSVGATGRMKVPRVEAKFRFRVRGRGVGSSPILSNYVAPQNSVSTPLLPVGPDGSIPFANLGQVALASTAFPLAFAPERIDHCPHTGASVRLNDEGMPTCAMGEAVSLEFVDGGGLDNFPLRVAAQLASRGLEGTSGRVRTVPDIDSVEVPSNVRFVLVEPHIDETIPALRIGDDRAKGFLPLLQTVGGNMLTATRAKELQALMEERPALVQVVRTAPVRLIPVSSGLEGFFGFFEQDLREADFVFGMQSAASMIDEYLSGEVARRLPSGVDLRPGEVGHEGDLWDAFRCLRAVIDGKGDSSICMKAGPGPRAAAQASIALIASRCATRAAQYTALHLPVPATPNVACRAGISGLPLPAVPGGREFAAWAQKSGESDFDHLVRLLSGYGLPFTEMGPDQAPTALTARAMSRLADVVGRFVTLQDPGSPTVGIVANLASQALSYRPTPLTFSLLLGRSLELGISGTPLGFAPALRLTAAVGWSSTLAADFAWLPTVGLEFELLPLSSVTFNARLGVRGGFRLASTDGYGTAPCTGDALCSRLTSDFYLGLQFLGIGKLMVGWQASPAFAAAPAQGFPFASAGMEFGFR